MWDTVQETSVDRGLPRLSHSMPCQRCGHELHVFLSCGDSCDCQPVSMPGQLGALLLAG